MTSSYSNESASSNASSGFSPSSVAASMEAAMYQSMETSKTNNVTSVNNSVNASSNVINSTSNNSNYVSSNNSSSGSAYRVSISGEDPNDPKNASNNYVTKSGAVNPSATSVVSSGSGSSHVGRVFSSEGTPSVVNHFAFTNSFVNLPTKSSSVVSSASSSVPSSSAPSASPSIPSVPSSVASSASYVPQPTPTPIIETRMGSDSVTSVSSSSAQSSVASSSSTTTVVHKKQPHKNPKIYLQATAFVKTNSGKRQILTEPVEIDKNGKRKYVYTRTIKSGKNAGKKTHMMPVSRKTYNAMMVAGHKPSKQITSDADFDKAMKARLDAHAGITTKNQSSAVLSDDKYKTTFRAKISKTGNGTLIPNSKGNFQKVDRDEQEKLTDANKAVANRTIGDNVNSAGSVTNRPSGTTKSSKNTKATGKAKAAAKAAQKQVTTTKQKKSADRAAPEV